MADGLLSNVLGAVDRKKQEVKAGLGLLADNPQEWAAQATARYFPTKEEEQQYRAVKQAGGDITQTPYYQKIFDLTQFQGSLKPISGQSSGLLRSKDTNFSNWFQNSKVLTEGNEPLPMYHGTGKDFDAFQENKRGVHFLSPSPDFANKYAGSEYSVAVGESPNVIPAYVKAVNPFDFENKKHVNAVAVKAGLTPNAIKEVKQGLWSRIEDRTIMDAIKKLGFDGVYVKEEGVKNLGVFAPEQIKSIFNRGSYDPKDPRILYGGGLVGATQVEMPEKKSKK
jgi:hypothetical protein